MDSFTFLTVLAFFLTVIVLGIVVIALVAIVLQQSGVAELLIRTINQAISMLGTLSGTSSSNFIHKGEPNQPSTQEKDRH